MWQELIGTPFQAGGTSGTVTLPAGAIVIAIVAYATSAGSVSILGGASVPIPAGASWTYKANHTLLQANATSNTIVFSSTVSFWVLACKAGNL